jgi:hypothetical protein
MPYWVSNSPFSFAKIFLYFLSKSVYWKGEILMEEVFAKEFRTMMSARRTLVKGFNLLSVPVPSISTWRTEKLTHTLATVLGVSEPYFSALNNQEVQLVGRVALQKRQVLSDGSFRKTPNGDYVSSQIVVPHDDVAVFSTLSIGLRNYEVKSGRKVKYQPSKGFRYVDYVGSLENRRYIYLLPKNYVYPLNLCALILTVNKRRQYFHGARVAFQNGLYLYLYVVPFKHQSLGDARVLGFKPSINFFEEVRLLLNYWVLNGVIFDYRLTQLTQPLDGVDNLGVLDLEGTLFEEDFVAYKSSLADLKQDSPIEWSAETEV